jgi:hypothetical protein
MDLLIFSLTLQLTLFFEPEELDFVEKFPLETEVLILGTSHAEQSFVPKVLEKHSPWTWYNFGKARRTLAFNAALSERLRRRGVRPKCVVLVATYHDFNERPHPYMIYPMMEGADRSSLWWDFVLERRLFEPRTWFLCDRYSPTVRMMMSRSLSFIKSRRRRLRWKPSGDRGFIERQGHLRAQQKPAESKSFPFKSSVMNRNGFEKIMDCWAAVGVEVVVVDPPEFLGSRLSHESYGEAWVRIESVVGERGLNCRSFSDPEDPFLSDHLNFLDGGWGAPNSHLSYKGAILFSQRFGEWMTSSMTFRDKMIKNKEIK